MQYIERALTHSNKLLIGITNPDPRLTRHQQESAHRASLDANFLTYYERHTLIKETLRNRGVDSSKYDIVPLPINFPELYKYYIPKDATIFLSIFEDWDYTKKKTL